MFSMKEWLHNHPTINITLDEVLVWCKANPFKRLNELVKQLDVAA